MSIGWKAECGYINSEMSEDYFVKSDFVKTDDFIFTVLTTLNSGVIPFYSDVPDVSRTDRRITHFDDPYTCAVALNQVYGEDYFKIYALPGDDIGTNNCIPRIQKIIPSIFLSCPNLLAISPPGETPPSSLSWYRYIYIPKLQRYIVFFVATAGRPEGLIYKEINNKIVYIGQLLSVRGGAPWCQSNNFFGLLSVPGYDGTKESLLNLKNLSFMNMEFGYDSRCDVGIGYNLDSSYNEFVDSLSLLFGDFSEPDINDPDNPYEPGGPSEPGGGGGTFDGDSDQIPDSSLPTLSCADTGFTRLYTPTLSQVQNLARYLWTDESIIDTLWNVVKRYFEDPMQAFISFSIVPVPVPVAGQEEFKVLFIPTGVMLNTVANQFVDVDCGTFEMKEYYGSALDYSPNTKVSCYLPYIGTVSLNTDDVMGRTLQVKYRVDICSGACVAKILVDGNVIYQFPGCCSVPIPFSSSDFSSYGSAIISAVKTGIAVAAGGVGMTGLGASLVGMDASQHTSDNYTKTTTTTARNPATGRQITTGTEKVTKEYTGTKASLAGIAQTGLSNTANEVTASKTVVERSGSFSGNSGYLGVRRPYLIIERPRMCMPANYQQLNGFPSMITVALSECKGYTRVQQVQLTGVEATNPEQAEILELLKGGVIL